MLCITLIILGCSKDDKEEFEPEPMVQADYNALYKQLYSTPFAGVSKESLPKWLIDKLNELENEHGSQLANIKVRIFKGEWKNNTVFLLNCKPFYACLLCNIFYNDGKQIVLDHNEPANFCTTSKNWTFIYEFGEALDVYEFPDISEMNDWESPDIIPRRLAALQMSDAVLANISTKGLLETCLTFPYLIDIHFLNDYQRGFNAVVAEFNGFRELLERPDYIEFLIEKYKNFLVEIEGILNLELIEQGRFSFQHFAVEMMLAQDAVLNNLSTEQEKQLILLSFEHTKMEKTYPDVFGGINSLSTILLYAKIIMNDSDFQFENDDMKQALTLYIQEPGGYILVYIEIFLNITYQQMGNFLVAYIFDKYDVNESI